VTVIDGASDEILATVAVGEQPDNLVYNPVNNKVYCLNRIHFGTVTVIDGARNAVLATVPVGDYASDLVYNPTSNRVYCSNWEGANVTVIDGATNQVVTTITVGEGPGSLLHNPSGNVVFCAMAGTDSVTVIDGATNVVLATVGVGWAPWELVLNPAQNRVYVANSYSSSISVLRGSLTGVEKGRALDAPRVTPTATVVRGVLSLGVDSRQHSACRPALLDISGRKVLELRPGPNDVRHLPPGVYFVMVQDSRGQGLRGSSVRKVAVAR